MRRLLAAARAGRTLVLDGFSRADLVAAALVARLPRPPRTIVTDCTWKTGRGRLDRLLTRAGVRAVDGPHVTFCVSSSDELECFPSLWGVPPARAALCRWYHGLTDAELAAPVTHDGPLFAGGVSLRDYRPLLGAAAAGLPRELRIAARPADLPRDVAVPPGVRVGRVDHDEYMSLLRGAALVVVPLERRDDRSAGQSTYLAAMALGKTVVVTDTLGVRDHVEPGRTGLVVPPGDAHALRGAILWALDPANAAAVAELRERARDTARTRFAPGRYVEALLALVDGGSSPS